MRILIHTMYFLPDFGSAPVLMDELARYLTDKGFAVEVLTTFPRKSDDPRYVKRLFLREQYHGYIVKRFWTPSHPSAIVRLIAWSLYTVWTMAHLFWVHSDDVLFLRLPPLQLAFTGVLGRIARGSSFVLNVQDIHPDLAIEAGILKNPVLIRVIKRIERWIYDRAPSVAVISDGFKRNLQDKGVPEEKVPVLPNWVDTDFFKPYSKDNAVSRKFKLHDRFVAMYAGTISISSIHALEQLLAAAEELRPMKDFLLVIVGEGMKKNALVTKAERYGLENVVFLPFQPHDDVPLLFAASDILLVPLDAAKSQLSVPSKLYTSMASGRTIMVLSEPEAETAHIVRQAGCGVVVPPHDTRLIAQTVRQIQGSVRSQKEYGVRARSFAEEYFSKDKVLDKYRELLCGYKG